VIKISIIIPVYNAERYIVRCIESILCQTFSDWELILINDGSTDASGRICDEFAIEDDRIVVIHQDNHGVSCARNLGMKLAKGKYLLFIDADDYIDIKMLEKMLYPAETYDVDIVLCDIEISPSIKLDIPINKILEHDFIMGILYPLWFNGGCNLNSVCAKLYRREMFLHHEIWFENRKRGEDWLFNITLFQYVRSIYYIPLPLYTYVRHADSAMAAFLPEQFDLWIENRRIWYNIIQKYGLSVDYESSNTQWVKKVLCYLILMISQDSQYQKKLYHILHSAEFHTACLNSYRIESVSFQIVKILITHNRLTEAIFLLKLMSWWIYKRKK
jgi:glycosyltransferase involved in cell wall biosynthesis